MKTSNKILLGAFLTALLLLISVHIAIYAKYKKGDYTEVTDAMWMPNMATISLQDVKFVTVDNIENVSLHLSDSSKLQYDKPGEKEENILTFTKVADTLFVAGKNNHNNGGRWYRQAHLYLADGLPLKAINTNLHLIEKSGSAATFSLSLDNSSININGSGDAAPFGLARISAVNASRIFISEAAVSQLSVQLHNSTLEENLLKADSISIQTDAASQIKLRGENLMKAKISTHE